MVSQIELKKRPDTYSSLLHDAGRIIRNRAGVQITRLYSKAYVRAPRFSRSGSKDFLCSFQ